MIFIKRGLEYLKRKIGKTILLSIIFIVIANFIIAGLLIEKASINAQTNTRLAVGADVTYELNLETVIGDVQKGLVERGELQAFKSGGVFSSENISNGGGPTIENIGTVVDSDYVKSFYYAIDTKATSSLQAYVGQDSELSYDFKFSGYAGEISNITMVEGSYDSSSLGTVIISQEVADLNKINLGDEVDITHVNIGDEDTKLTYKVAGIYTTEETINNAKLSSDYPQNKIYGNFLNYQNAGLTSQELDQAVLSTSTIVMNDPEDIDAFKASVEEKMDFKYGTLNANDSLYNSLVGPIESIGLITKIFVVSIIVTGGFIIGLITALTINDRKGEIGILLAVGESKIKIVSQFILEVILIAVVAFTLSTFTGEILGEKMSETLLDSEVFGEQQEVQTGFAAKNFRNSPFGNASKEVDLDVAKEAAKLDIGLDTVVIIQIFGIGLLLTVISTSIPALYVMRFSPKEILSNRNS